MQANGGNLVGLYTPTSWNGGSSVSHLDTDNAAYSSLMMAHSRPPGLTARTLDPIEVGIWMDLGFNMTGVSNSAPVAVADSGTGFETDEAMSFTIGDLLANDFDPDPGETETLYISSVDTTSTTGTVNVVGTGMQTRFTSTGPFAIPPFGPPSTYDLTVSGVSGMIRDVNVNLNITHDYTLEYTITVISPNGTRVKLIENRGGSEDNFTDTYLNDEALIEIGESASSHAALSPFTSSFRPEEPLSAFDGEFANGTWQLEIQDPYGNSVNPGSLDDWSLDIIAQHVTYDPNGQFDYLGDGQQATDTFTYTLMDENGNSDTAMATITINGDGLPQVTLPYSEDFNDDVADNLAFVGESRWGIYTDSGDKSLVFNGRSSYGLGVAYFDTAAPLPSQYEIVSKVSSWSTPNVWYDGFLVFDYQGPNDFKYAGMFTGQNEWIIGHYQGNWGNRIAEFDMDDVGGDIKADREYVLLLTINGDDVELFVDGIKRISTTFVGGINNGTAGVAAYNAWTAFDDLEIGTSVSYGKPVENPFFEDFDDSIADQMYFNHPNYWKTVSPGDQDLLRVNTSYTDLLAVAHVPLDPDLALYDFTVSADVRSLEPNVGLNNGFLVFDYRHDNDFKYAGFLADENKWVIGHYQGDFNNRAAELEASVTNVPINVRQWYRLEILIIGDYVGLSADGQFLINASFGDGYLSQGAVGLASDRSFTWFDDFYISEDGITTSPAADALFAEWQEESNEILI
ncbi:MAG: proprotein convertase P-domain-containing protein, partial [Planctomycetaceae bacterium]|nr:proprotein convertase P-domain-containing protein [Planctomycetaceae bacterium]